MQNNATLPQSGPVLDDLLKSQTRALMLFAYVQGARRANPNISISAAIFDFLEYFAAEDFNFQTARYWYYTVLNSTMSK